jgi:hypothetical protein
MVKPFGTPGPRAIHPELCDSPSLGRCGILANALFPRLIAMADDQGRLAGEAHDLLVQCMPKLLRVVTVDAVAEALDELEAVNMIRRYTVRGEALVQLEQWWRWQQGARRAYPSRWPAPPKWRDMVYGVGGDTPETYVAASRSKTRQSAADRSTSPRSAATRVGADAGAHVGPRTGANRASTSTNTVPSREGAANGAAPRGGLRTSAQAILDDPHASAEAKAGAQAVLEMGGQS